MPINILSDIELNKNQTLNRRMQQLATAPASPVTGQEYYNTTTNDANVWNGTEWVSYDARNRNKIPVENLATNPLARANHTGTQTASTISDFDAKVRTSALNQMAVPAADLNLNSKKITNLAAPTSSNDAARLVDVNNALAGIAARQPVRAVSTANITLSGTQTIDGVALAVGNDVLVTGQSTASQNGVYTVAAAAWARRTEEDAANELIAGATWLVTEGTANAGSSWRLATIGAITVGTTSISIVKADMGNVYSAGNGISISGTTIAARLAAGEGLRFISGQIGLDPASPLTAYHADVLLSTLSTSDNKIFKNTLFGANKKIMSICLFDDQGSQVFADISYDASAGVLTVASNVAISAANYNLRYIYL